MNKQQMTNLLGAGTITGLMVAAALFFGGGWGNQSDTAMAQPAGIAIAAEIDPLTAENMQLKAAVEQLQTRDEQYRLQIEEANTLLAEQAGAAGSYEGEYEEHEYEEDEDHDEYEDDEYEDEAHGEYEHDEDEYEDEEEDEEDDD